MELTALGEENVYTSPTKSRSSYREFVLGMMTFILFVLLMAWLFFLLVRLQTLRNSNETVLVTPFTEYHYENHYDVDKVTKPCSMNSFTEEQPGVLPCMNGNLKNI